jgi:hypothetical protein
MFYVLEGKKCPIKIKTRWLKPQKKNFGTKKGKKSIFKGKRCLNVPFYEIPRRQF